MNIINNRILKRLQSFLQTFREPIENKIFIFFSSGEQVRIIKIFRDFGIFTSVDGLLVEEVSALVGPGDVGSGARWEVAAARRAIDAARLPLRERRVLTCFRAVQRELPGLQLALVSTDPPDPRGPGAAADITFVRMPPDPGKAGRAIDAMGRAGWLSPEWSRRVGLWLESDRPPADRDLMAITRRFQREGGVALCWSSDDPVTDQPAAAVVAPAVSANLFPRKF